MAVIKFSCLTQNLVLFQCYVFNLKFWDFKNVTTVMPMLATR